MYPCSCFPGMYTVVAKEDSHSREIARHVEHALKRQNSKLAKDIASLSETDVLVCVGDDGFLLQTIRDLTTQPVVFAVSSSESFLAQASGVNHEYYLRQLLKGNYSVERKARLSCVMGTRELPLALNDVYLVNARSATLLRYALSVDGSQYWTDQADGVVVATPTGSTGYSLSAGGPVVVGDPAILTVTPLSSMEKKSPLVVKDAARIGLSVLEGQSPQVIIDGQVRVPLKGEVEIRRAEKDARFARFSASYEVESRLRQRGKRGRMAQLRSFSPSVKLMYKILAAEGSMTQKDLIEQSLLPQRTVRYALELLVDKGFVMRQASLSDARQSVYTVL